MLEIKMKILKDFKKVILSDGNEIKGKTPLEIAGRLAVVLEGGHYKASKNAPRYALMKTQEELGGMVTDYAAERTDSQELYSDSQQAALFEHIGGAYIKHYNNCPKKLLKEWRVRVGNHGNFVTRVMKDGVDDAPGENKAMLFTDLDSYFLVQKYKLVLKRFKING